ncbi:methyltransferase domain-containing protein [Shimia ponticola]|uniref:methyltransferase domain-containing protein n=1 Tax=Shimia ponticola TaxID=2582893 RepID=UPI00164B6399|nr:class I SAM-dependent methyltransferase [Shimia ponticola]
MTCPACGTGFAVKPVETDADALKWGLLGCDCFDYPVIDGVALLSLSKGYGGAEERFQPYQALLSAGVHYLERRDVGGLKRWVRRHIPVLANLIDRSDSQSYYDFIKAHMRDIELAFARTLSEDGRYGLIGWTPSTAKGLPLPAALANFPNTYVATLLFGMFHRFLRKPEDYWYVSRWMDGRLSQTKAGLSGWPMRNRSVLSLACGHGIAEALFLHLDPATEILSMDGQIMNVWITKSFVNPAGDYAVYDLTAPLPFEDGAFDVAFCSTSFQEIPQHALFSREKIRVTKAEGLAYFDFAWWPANRVNPLRAYRYCQNMVDTPESVGRIISTEALRLGRQTFAHGVPADIANDTVWAPSWADITDDPGDACGPDVPGASFAVSRQPPSSCEFQNTLNQVYWHPSAQGQGAPPKSGEDLQLMLQSKEALILPAKFKDGAMKIATANRARMQEEADL